MQHRAAASNGGSEKGASTEEDYIYVGVTGERDEGYLGAFYSPDCRDDQTALDGIDTEALKVPIRMMLAELMLVEILGICVCA
ncbi:hypothetical protein QQP08_012406 [Theobroma cacao]|nr:hypothetical protein QQP08_012406 [Theobroma cacao]